MVRVRTRRSTPLRTNFPFTVAAATVALLTLPAAAGAAGGDRNRDGIPDRWERTHKLALVPGQDARDQDRDGLTNLVEWQARTNPRRRDSDRDGTPDGREDGDRDGLRNGFEGPTGHDAREPDTDGDGVKDGKEGAGRVLGVAGTVVTIDLGAGRRAKATVTQETVSRCGEADEWLLGLFDTDEEDEELPQDGPAPDGPAEEAVDEVQDALEPLLPALRTTEEGDDAQAPSGDEPPAEDEGAVEEDGEDEGSCPDGAVRKGTWVHASDVQEGAFSWLDVVLRD